MTRETIDEIRRRWFEVPENDPTNTREALPIPGVRHYLNHWVLITRGEHAGTRVSIISLEGLDPEPTYLAELPDGTSILVEQSRLTADEETWNAAEQGRRGFYP